MSEPHRVATILAIDGGGIRGLIPALILADLEQRLKRLGSKKPLVSAFDLIAGSSTGALIALGLALPKPQAKEKDADAMREPAFDTQGIVDLYERHGHEIFPPTTGRIRSTRQIFKSKYDGLEFERLLAGIFGEATLRDGLTNLLITTFDTVSLEPRCMKNRPSRSEWRDDMDFYMKDAARASAAAPTYFPPVEVSPVPANGERYCLVDGSIFANNPSFLAYVETRKIHPEAEEFLIVSLGTGEPPKGYTYGEIAGWGYFEWLNPMRRLPLWSMMAAGQGQSVNHMLGRMEGVHYSRISGILDGCSPDMDDASPANLAALREVALHLIVRHDAELEAIAKSLCRA